MASSSLPAYLRWLWPTTLLLATVPKVTNAQVVTPTSISFNSQSNVCNQQTETVQVCVDLPQDSVTNKIDLFFLLDDTFSFEPEQNQLAAVFNRTIAELQTALQLVEFGFGVGRFEDYGGEGRTFGGGGSRRDRPFILNQPIVTQATVGSATLLQDTLYTALTKRSEGYGGDGPEAAISEGLAQVALGVGFDGNADGSSNGINGRQVAGRPRVQTRPDRSGDVPAFSTLLGRIRSSGNVGGAGFREDALKIVVLGTDICSIAAFDVTQGIPASISSPFATLPTSDFTCSNNPGQERFGFVSDSTSRLTNTIPNAVVPVGAHTLPQTITALNAAGIRVVGMAPDLTFRDIGSGPSTDESVFLSALARITGAVDETTGNPLVVNMDLNDENVVVTNLVNMVVGVSQIPSSLSVTAGTCTDGITSLQAVSVPLTSGNLGPGDGACFQVEIQIDPNTTPVFPVATTCPLTVNDANLNLPFANVPVSLTCTTPATNAPTNVPTNVPTESPTNVPTNDPTNAPTLVPSSRPSTTPSFSPTDFTFLFPLPTQSPTVSGATVSPNALNFGDASNICSLQDDTVQVCLRLPPQAISDKIDVFFLLDDTASFQNEIQQLQRIFNDTVAQTQAALPNVEWAFGVGRFEDYGGLGHFYGEEGTRRDRPFILNQPIVTTADALGADQFQAILYDALTRESPGTGGDGPEAAVSEALYLLATGVGLDGNNDNMTTGNNGRRTAGNLNTQTRQDNSGDVPAFSTLDSSVRSSGTVGGAGFREDALKIVILATDICSVAAFDINEGIPPNINGPYVSENPFEFACSSVPGERRVGFIGNSFDGRTNTIPNAVAPMGAHTVPQSIAAINAAGIRVVGMAPDVTPLLAPQGPSTDEAVFLSALGRITGTVDAAGFPYLINMDLSNDAMVMTNIVQTLMNVAQIPGSLGVSSGSCDDMVSSLDVSSNPVVVNNIAPNSETCLEVTLRLDANPANFPIDTTCGLVLEDPLLNLEYATVPVSVQCTNGAPSGSPSLRPSSKPSSKPSASPSRQPSFSPSTNPTNHPSDSPSSAPSAHPSFRPSVSPSDSPSKRPTTAPSTRPSAHPSRSPSSSPTGVPTAAPSAQPSANPTEFANLFPAPTNVPTRNPTKRPTLYPTKRPTPYPTRRPSSKGKGKGRPSPSPPTVVWNQLGQQLEGEAAYDFSGITLDISSDGRILAVGATRNDGTNGRNSGHVRVYQYDGSSTWDQLGQDLDGESTRDRFGSSVALSSNGFIVAIGAVRNDGRSGVDSGHVRVYEYDGSSMWNQRGQDLDGEAAGDRAGSGVALSADGSIVAVGAKWNDSNGKDSGHVLVYRYDSSRWNQLGQELKGLARDDIFGESVALSADGNTLVVGAPLSRGSGYQSGQFRAFQFNGRSWNQLGQTVNGEAARDFAGYSVDISTDGSIVAIGAYGNDDGGTSSGHVRVFRYNGYQWVQLGQDLNGQDTYEYFGSQVALSNDGMRLAAGAEGHNRGQGEVRVFQYDGSRWNRVGAPLEGRDRGNFGYSVAMSGDGRIVAGGGPYSDDNGTQSGTVRVFTQANR